MSTSETTKPLQSGGSALNDGLERILNEVKKELTHLYLAQGRTAIEESLLCAAVADCVTAIRVRSNRARQRALILTTVL
jgi:hypothetical protein